MAPRGKTTASAEVVTIKELDIGSAEIGIIGIRPIILNSMNAKAKVQLCLGGKGESKVTMRSRAKHDPVQEFIDAPYKIYADTAPTLLAFPAAGLKRAISRAAIDSGARRTEIGRWVWVESEFWRHVPLYGIPSLYMAVVRNSDINRTPDIRTRAIVAEWGMVVRVNFIEPHVNQKTLATLIQNAGKIIGIGDDRPEKGADTFGQFRFVDAANEDLQRIMANGGRDAQLAAMEAHEPYDDETEELLALVTEEANARGFKLAA